MENSGWKHEKIVLLVLLVLVTITALITTWWAWSFVLWLIVYIVWKIIEFRLFYQWYMDGASKKQVPEIKGVFEALICRVLTNKNQTRAAEKHNQFLLKQFVTMAQALPFATLLLNHRFEINWVNNASGKILNISENDINSKIDNIIRAPEFVTMLEGSEGDQEIKLHFASENKKSIHIRLIKINKYRYLLVARDISAQEALQKSRKAFIANASHELRTPLTVVTGYLEMLLTSGQLSEEWIEAVNQASHQARRMGNIIDGMLELSKIEHDKALETKDEILPMPELINSLFNDIKSSSDAAEYDFFAEVDSSLNIQGKESEITSICLNLMHNAIIHTPKGTQVSIKWFILDDEANFWVNDNGTGIDAKHIPHLTERFYRVDNSRAQNHQSTGLGLAIVKHICLKHQARFEIDSEKGVGTTFKVIFPSFRTVIV